MKFIRKPEIVEGWQYQPGAQPPQWVRLQEIPGHPDERAVTNYNDIHIGVSPGDYLIRLDGTDEVFNVYAANVFEERFRPFGGEQIVNPQS